MVRDLEELNKRLDTAINIKELWLETYLDVYRYVTPNRDDRNLYGNYTKDAKRRTIDIYDSTAVLAAYQRSNELQGLIIPQSRQWGNFKVEENRGSGKELPDNVIFELNKTVGNYIEESDLQVAAGAAFLDLTIGMGALWIDSPSDDEPLAFSSVSSLALYPEFTTDNLLSTAWIKKVMTGRQIMATYPEYGGVMLDKMKNDPDTPRFLWIGQIKKSDTEYFNYGVLDEDRLTLLYSEKKSYKRLIIFRDRVRPGEVQGRGVAIDLYPTIRDLNNIAKDFLKVMAYKANPPIFYDTASKFNPYSMRDIAGVYIPKVGERSPLEMMQTPEAPEVTEMVRDMRDTIKVGFDIDILGTIESPVRSATEVSIRENRAQRTSGTNIARLINELPKELFKSCANILNEKQLLGSNVDLNDKRLRFDYVSPLLDIEKQNNLQSLEQVTQFIQQNFGEQATLTAFNLKSLMPFLYDNFNLPPSLFTEGATIQKAIVQTTQQASQQAPQATTTATQPSAVVSPQTLV